MAKKKKKDFETALKELSDNVRKLEEGSISLAESLKLFEDSIKLSKFCSEYLSDAELRIKKLMETEMGINIEDFDED